LPAFFPCARGSPQLRKTALKRDVEMRFFWTTLGSSFSPSASGPKPLLFPVPDENAARPFLDFTSASFSFSLPVARAMPSHAARHELASFSRQEYRDSLSSFVDAFWPFPSLALFLSDEVVGLSRPFILKGGTTLPPLQRESATFSIDKTQRFSFSPLSGDGSS